MALIFLCRSAAFITLALGFRFASAQLLLHKVHSSQLSGASKECLQALNGGVECAEYICSLNEHPRRFFDRHTLDNDICTSSCYDSLLAHRENIVLKCPEDAKYYPSSNHNKPYRAVTHLTDKAIHNYNFTCLKQSDGQYCNLFNQANAITIPPQGLHITCNECYFRSLELDIASPIEADKELKTFFLSTWTDHCGYNSHPEIPTDPSHIIPIETPICSFPYAIKPGDTFLGVSVALNIATHELARANGLDLVRGKLPSSGSLCVRNQCSIHVVEDGDDCGSIATQHGITIAQLLLYNRYLLRSECWNVANAVGQAICVSPPLHMHTYIPRRNTTIPLIPEPNVHPPLAAGTRDDCWSYLCQEDEGLPEYQLQSPDTVAWSLNVELEDLINWNPSLAQMPPEAEGTNKHPPSSTLALSMSYCVGLRPTANAA